MTSAVVTTTAQGGRNMLIRTKEIKTELVPSSFPVRKNGRYQVAFGCVQEKQNVLDTVSLVGSSY